MGNQKVRRLTLLFGGLLSPGGACLATTGAKRRPNPPDTERRAMLMYVILGSKGYLDDII